VYRPQFPYAAPRAKCEGQRCHYSFDGTNTPSIISVAAGAVLTKIPLRMDQDAPFFLRGIQVSSDTGLLLRLEDCFENPLLTDSQVISPALWCDPDGAGVVAMESDNWGIYCPAGGSLLLYVTNPTNAAVATLVINLHGEKWYSEGTCS
jgi:hypothetical protein